ncbi:MAG: acyl carrier protein [FCB group bacterium]|jgi:acyl carrier protein|nr:acyl carrier protein [FCB group bacterium]
MSETDPIRTKVKAVLSREWGLDADSIPNDAALNHFARWDSLGHIAVMLALANEFEFELTAETVQALRSVPRIVEFVTQQGTMTVKGTSHAYEFVPGA